MRIGLLTNFWYVRGGLERVVFGDARGLGQRGHVVLPFASAHDLNEPADTGRFFPPNVEHGSLGSGMGLRQRGSAAISLFHNRDAAMAFDQFADACRPDVVHQHGLARQFSPSVLERAKARGIPTVLTLHDYSLRCPSGDLSRPRAPECLSLSCAGHRYDRAVRFGCVHGSRMASALAAAELLMARALRRYERAVDAFLVPSEYVAARMREAGVPSERLRVMPNAVESKDEPVSEDKGYVLAFGRLVAPKGFGLVIELARRRPDVRFVVAGDGPERGRLEREARNLPNVDFVGFLRGEQLSAVIRDARVVIVPSEWPEPFGMVVLEAWQEGRPVVAARSGALPELVRDGETGYTFERGDADGAARVIDLLMADRALASRLGRNGWRLVESTYSLGAHLDRLESVYQGLVGQA